MEGCSCLLTRIISIHALREEGDGAARNLFFYVLYISIHALREEGDASSTRRRALT